MSRYRPVLHPNLPQGRVKAVAIGESYLTLVGEAFRELDIEIIPVPSCSSVDVRVNGHADLTTHHLGGNSLIVSSDTYDETYIRLANSCGKFGLENWDIIKGAAKFDSKYPSDIPLNALRIGQILFCNVPHTDVRLLQFCEENGIEIIHVNQGYARCSVCIVNEKAVITADPGLADSMEKKGIDVLRIRRGYIDLPGYDHGFIGGASGKISRDKLCFTGSLKDHPDYDSIEKFLYKRDVEPVILTERNCFDIGSIIPLIETIEE
ncbi:MAG: hypothetical protein GX193_09970 [Clostridiales bacterium]|nr:hypothetical protein [Clostridiales bacterium]